jgi:hypothetical protein
VLERVTVKTRLCVKTRTGDATERKQCNRTSRRGCRGSSYTLIRCLLALGRSSCSSAPSRLPDRLVGLDRAYVTHCRTRSNTSSLHRTKRVLSYCCAGLMRRGHRGHVHSEVLFQQHATRTDSLITLSTTLHHSAHSAHMSTLQLAVHCMSMMSYNNLDHGCNAARLGHKRP